MLKLKAALGGLLALACLSGAASAQIAAGKSKWIGNVSNSATPPSNFATYWNQMTPENATKWGSVEGTRNTMNWGTADALYAYAQQRGFPFKFHTFVWGSQFPSWLTGLSQAEQRAEIEQWMQLSCQRFPNTFAIDVVNEPIKTPLPFAAALGGTGTTGWDWVITSFQLARQFCPNAKLLINEYGTENDPGPRATYKTIINLLKARGLIDGIGIQSHYFNLDSMTGTQMTATLNDYATLGLDIYVSELDIINGNTDAGQLAKYQDVFPAIWNHASVKGITLWGYVVGQTWRDGTGLVTTAGVERPAMGWLRTFVAGTTPGPDTQAPTTPAGLTSPSRTSSSISLAWTASTDNVGVTAYDVLRAPGASGGTFASIGTSPTNSFTNSGLAANTTFRYQVRARDAAGNLSAVSNTVTQTTLTVTAPDTQAPSTPANLSAPSTTTSSISLAWTASTDNVGVTGYQVLRAPGASGGTFAQIGTSPTNSFANTGLAAGTTFRYQVRATDAAGNLSAVSNTVTAATQTSTPDPGGTCANAITFSGNTGNFGTTGAACYRTNTNISGWGCYNFDGRTLTVGGVARTCGQMPLTRAADGFYYFAVTAGQFPWAGIFAW